jgi:ABC-type dipeptide/oligopeptide/nickel transport system ATPase subunit
MIAILKNVGKSYGKRSPVRALRNVSLSLPQARRIMIVGESGSGKSTLVKCLAGWEAPDEGAMQLFCERRPQLIPQEPASSLNPAWDALAIVAEPFRIRGHSKPEANERALEFIRRVELPAESVRKLSIDFSGGEQARLAIARGLAAVCSDRAKHDTPGARQGFLIFDESFSSLDEELRTRLFSLLLRLQDEFCVTYAFVSHDLSIVARFADFIAVLDAGELVEFGNARDVLGAPASFAMKRLLSGFGGLA